MSDEAKTFSLARLLSADLGIDLGTETARVTSRKTGEVFSAPAVVARHRRSGEVWGVGRPAADLIARMPEAIEEVRPLRDGAIADYDAAVILLRALLQHARNRMAPLRPRVVMSVPCELTQVERRALISAARGAGAREVYLLAAPMAAALGAGVAASERGGKLVIDVGAGTTDVAVVTLSGVVHARTMRMGGTRLDEAVRAWLKRKLDVEVGLAQARALKEQLGSAFGRQDLRDVTIDARDRVTGALRVVRVRAEELREALAPAVAQLVDAVRIVIEDAPPELAADIAQNGIVLAGGGARLDGLAELLMRELRLPVAVAKDPQTAGVTGCGLCLDRFDLLRDLQLEARAQIRQLDLAAA
jgi:rod shape-determining protein MreB and related proteins